MENLPNAHINIALEKAIQGLVTTITFSIYQIQGSFEGDFYTQAGITENNAIRDNPTRTYMLRLEIAYVLRMIITELLIRYSVGSIRV
jgi:hypothetical protein